MPRPLGIPHARKPSVALDTETALYALEHLRRKAMDVLAHASPGGVSAQNRRLIQVAFAEAAAMVAPNLLNH